MKKISIYLSVFLVVLMVGIYFVFWPKTRFELAKGVMAGGGFPYQIGLTGVIQIQCFTTGSPPACTGGTMCSIKDATSCGMYSDVSGSPSGGMGAKALMLSADLMAAGVSSEMIAGGTGMTMMDSNRVVAGMGGCAGSGCTAINDKNIFQKYYEIIKYGIASFKD